MKDHVLQAFEKIPVEKKPLKFHLELKFDNFQERKNGTILD